MKTAVPKLSMVDREIRNVSGLLKDYAQTGQIRESLSRRLAEVREIRDVVYYLNNPKRHTGSVNLYVGRAGNTQDVRELLYGAGEGDLISFGQGGPAWYACKSHKGEALDLLRVNTKFVRRPNSEAVGGYKLVAICPIDLKMYELASKRYRS